MPVEGLAVNVGSTKSSLTPSDDQDDCWIVGKMNAENPPIMKAVQDKA
jgi:hypothetical protein